VRQGHQAPAVGQRQVVERSHGVAYSSR
jgi:hypothetical protein